jgi:uncharacterized lipoprotein NlpE involved in copper resistance
MKRWLLTLFAVLGTLSLIGCSGSEDKGKFRNKDRPISDGR